MSCRIKIDLDRQCVTLHAAHTFDLSLGFSFWQYTQPDVYNYNKYVFDFAEVKELRDSGLGWLLMFLKHAWQTDADVQFINASPAILYRLSLLKITIDHQGFANTVNIHR